MKSIRFLAASYVPVDLLRSLSPPVAYALPATPGPVATHPERERWRQEAGRPSLLPVVAQHGAHRQPRAYRRPRLSMHMLPSGRKVGAGPWRDDCLNERARPAVGDHRSKAGGSPQGRTAQPPRPSPIGPEGAASASYRSHRATAAAPSRTDRHRRSRRAHRATTQQGEPRPSGHQQHGLTRAALQVRQLNILCHRGSTPSMSAGCPADIAASLPALLGGGRRGGRVGSVIADAVPLGRHLSVVLSRPTDEPPVEQGDQVLTQASIPILMRTSSAAPPLYPWSTVILTNWSLEPLTIPDKGMIIGARDNPGMARSVCRRRLASRWAGSLPIARCASAGQTIAVVAAPGTDPRFPLRRAGAGRWVRRAEEGDYPRRFSVDCVSRVGVADMGKRSAERRASPDDCRGRTPRLGSVS